MQPIFRWAGSKRYLADTLIPKFPNEFERYVEPFCGSASLFFLLEPRSALLSDINEELVNAFSQVTAHPRKVAQIASDLPSDEDDYYDIRNIEPRELSPLHRAARFVYLNRLCFNGLYRTNAAGKFNVPYSGYRTAPPKSASEMQAAAKILKRAEVRCLDFRQCVARARRGDFFYIDPPYVSVKKRQFTDYHEKSFASTDIPRLREALRRVDTRGGKFMLSYAKCDDILPIAKEWNCEYVTTRRNIAGFAGHRKQADEVVVTNYS